MSRPIPLKETPMKTLFSSLLLSLLLATQPGPAAAQTNVAGKWQGRLEIQPGKTMTIHFVITAAPGGGYSAVVTSPDNGGIKDVKAESVKFADNKLAIAVPALSGGYAGTLRNGVLEGEWSQEGSKLPLSLKPYQAPSLSKEDIALLNGEWSGKLTPTPGHSVTIVLRFSTDAKGVFKGVLDVPEQGVKDWAGSAVDLDDGHFLFQQPTAQVEIKGTLKGDQIVAQWIQMGNSVPLTLKKGKYLAPVNYLDLPAAARDQVKGRWTGTLGPLSVVVRFETDAQGRMRGFFDSPQQNLPNIPITEAKLEGTKFMFGIAGFGAKYTGDLAAGKLTGEWTQLGMPKPAPLVLNRDK
jgi:hypothetical protein